MIEGDAFITPHAIRQFQDRIARIEYERAREIIIQHLREHTVRVTSMPDGHGAVARVRGGDFAFRAVIVPREPEPSVVIILRSGK